MKKEQPNMTDKELDNFFRKTSGQFDIPYEPGDWKKLEAKLDQLSGKSGLNGSGIYKVMGSLSIVILLAVMITAMYLSGVNRKNAETPWVKSDLGTLDQAGRGKGESEAMAGADPSQTKVGVDLQISEERPAGLASKVEADDFQDQQPGIEQVNGIESPTEFRARPEKVLSDNLYGKIKAFKFSSLSERIYTTELREGLSVSKTAMNIKIPDQNIADFEGTKRGLPYDRFSATLVFAPDISALKFNDIEGLGNSLGLNMEYFAHTNISLNIGVLYAFKTYRGEGGYSGYIPSPERMKGDCWMWDIPLNLRYYIINRDLGRWYISTGISSYMMLREKYNLTYKTYSGYQYESEVDVKDSNRHYLGIMNFSMGYERLLSDKIAIQVEPYLKLPFRGIGEGRVNLKSSGVLIGLKYSW